MTKQNEELTNAYRVNEVSANKHMTYALLLAAFLLFLVLFGYVFNTFSVADGTRTLTLITIPILEVILCMPAFFIKTNALSKHGYKYFLLTLFIFFISALNVIMPKHGILGWAVVIALTAHYYSPKVTRIVFAIVLIMMFACLNLGMFFGEFDGNLLSGELNVKDQTIHSYLLPDVYEDTPQGRLDYLSALIKVGQNRYVKVYTQYYLGRALFTTLIYAITVFLNKRTRNLLNNEILVSNENQKNKTELEVAKEIQLNTLPGEMKATKDVEIIGELKAAKEVGGDLYDYLKIDEDHVAVLIGDVSGKGVPAAMFMMKTITSFRAFAKKNKTPSEILKEINVSILKGNKASMFVTCFLAILDIRDGKIVFANAGHNKPIVGYERDYHYLDCFSGCLLGCFKEIVLKDEEIVLKPGESMTFYTDGITEARNDKGEFFGEERFLETFNHKDYTCILELHHEIKDAIAAFVKDAPQSDDITFITLKYRGDNYSYVEKEFPAKKEKMPQMLSFISDFTEQHNCPPDFVNKVTIVGDELFSNIIKHGYENGEGLIYVRLLFDEDKKEFVLTIIDTAKQFNQLEVNNPEVGTDAKQQKVGGLGILIVKKIMDQYAYDYINGKNILVLKKKF